MHFRTGFTALSFCWLLFGCNTGPDSGQDPIKVKGGSPEDTFADITFEGSGFLRFEKRTVEIRIGSPALRGSPEDRLAFAQVKVYGGAFRVEFRKVREVGLYKPFGLFFDVDGDGKCTVGKDAGYQGATGGQPDPYVFNVEDWMILPMSAEDCAFFAAPWTD